MKCGVCGNDFDKSLGMCPFCGYELPDDVVVEEQVLYCEPETVSAANVPPRRKTWVWMLSALVLGFVAFSIGFYLHYSVGKRNGRVYSEEEISEICDLLDYSALSATLENYCESIEDTYVYDADADGRKELFITAYTELYRGHPVVFAFDTIDTGTMATTMQLGIAGDTQITSGDSDTLNLKWGYYSSDTSKAHYAKWTDDGWHEITSGVPEDSSDTADIGNTSCYTLTSRYYDVKNYEDIIDAYTERLNVWCRRGYRYLEEDMDGDGEGEYAFILSDYGKLWMKNFSDFGADGILMKNYIQSLADVGTVCIYADTDEDGIVFHTFFTRNPADVTTDVNGHYSGDDVRLSWENGELLIKIIKNKAITADHFFCSEAKLSKESVKSNEDAFRKVSELYVQYLKNHFYSDVLVKYADICKAFGDELICVCTNQGTDRTNIYAVYCGRMITLYEQNPIQTGAVYFTTKDGETLLLTYNQQSLRNDERQGTNYSYSIIGFNERYGTDVRDEQFLCLYTDKTPTASDNAFFTRLNTYLDVATVCVDRYELTGYRVMPSVETDRVETETSKYLSISNCNLNKKGKVNVGANYWLNFREGPAVKYDRVLTDPTDSESYVMQMDGASVTVIDTENTGDAENPVWVKIQIKYSDQTLIGYSSQRYIEIPDIKHVAVGETFTVEADTNDDGLRWSSNDEKILQIDGSTGKVTGKKKGLALVSVESNGGLKDSCLIMVD